MDEYRYPGRISKAGSTRFGSIAGRIEDSPRQSIGGTFGKPERPVQHTNQRTVQNLLCLGKTGPGKRRDYGLSLEVNMMVRIPTHRLPTHPGEMLREEFLVPMNISQRDLASAIHVPYQRVNELVNQRRGVTPSTALRLAKFFGMSADFWLNLQVRWDLFKAQSSEAEELRSIEDYHHLQKMA